MGNTISNSGMLIYIIADLSCILMLVPILRNLRTSVGSEGEITSLRYMIWSFFLYVIADLCMVSFMDEGHGLSTWVCSVITIIDELSLLFVGYFWFEFGINRLNIRSRDKNWFMILSSLPFLLVVILSISSPMTGYFFSFGENGMYERGPLFMIQAGVVLIYNMTIPIMSIYKLSTTKSATERSKAISLIKFVIAPLSTGVVQLLNPNTPIMCLGLVVGIYFVYVDTLNLQIYNDSLTGLNNRRRAEIFLSDCITATTKERPFYVFMIDVDYFKGINDKYGHVEGDHALRLVAEALKKTADANHGFAARLGGDEFLISTFNNSIQDPEKIKQDLDENLRSICENNHIPYQLIVSVGYAKCDSHQTKIINLFNEADQMLYEKKDKHHAMGR